MKKSVKYLLFILVLVNLLVSCAHKKVQERKVASKSECLDSVKGEYQSYFDSVEKCIEKQPDK